MHLVAFMVPLTPKQRANQLAAARERIAKSQAERQAKQDRQQAKADKKRKGGK